MLTSLRGSPASPRWGVLLPGFLLVLPLADPPAPDADSQTIYEQLVSAHFNLPPGEARLLLEEGIAIEELPVVLLLARERGLSPSVVISRRQRSPVATPWIEVARQMSLGAGVFHVELTEADADDTIRRAVELFRNAPRDRWNGLQLSDEEIVILSNVQVLARSLQVENRDVLQARSRAGTWPAAAEALVGQSHQNDGRGLRR